jgi:hypothetical protein
MVLVLPCSRTDASTVLTSPAIGAFGVFVVVGTLAFIVGAMYLGGGSEAVRRQSRRLVVLAAGFVAVVFAVPVLMSALGERAWAVVLVAMNAAVIGALVYRSRRASPLVVERQRAAIRMPAFRVLVLAWVGAMTIGAILLSLAARAGD